MDFSFLSQINYLAVAVSSIIFFLLGSFWYSVLFGSIWANELKQHNVIIKEPSKGELLSKMLLTFLANCIASYSLACLVVIINSTTAMTGLWLGLIAAAGIAATTLASVFIWESRSLKLFLIDLGYPVLGIIASTILLSLWH